MRSTRVILHTVLALTGLGLRAQDTTQAGNGWSIGVSGALDVCYRTTVVVEEGQHTDLLVDMRNDMEIQRTSFTAGVDVEYAFNDHWIMATGMQFSDRGYGTEAQELIAIDFEPFVIGTAEWEYHYRFMSFPFMVRYSIGNGAWRFLPSTGIWIDRLHEKFTRWTITHTDGSHDTGRSTFGNVDFNDWGASACLELPVSVALCDRVDLRFGPRARYQFTQLTNTPITDHLWEGGFLLGAMIRL